MTKPFETLEPKLDSVLGEFVEQVWEGAMDSATLELCRVRMAMLLGSEVDAALRTPQANDSGAGGKGANGNGAGGADGRGTDADGADDKRANGSGADSHGAQLEAKLAALSEWPTSPLFSDADRAALDFCEKYAIDPHTITDEDCVEMNRWFSEPELTNLTFALAVFESLIRSRVALAQLGLRD